MDDKHRDRAEEAFTTPPQNDREKAWAEYKAKEDAVNERTAKLRAQRLARAAATLHSKSVQARKPKKRPNQPA
jgi:hypothetical protein